MSSPRRPTLIWFGLLVILVAIAAYYLLKGPSTPRPRPNILLITMDSLRGDHLGCAGHQGARTPTIDALAREGAHFTQAISQSTYTRISVPSMITGKYPYDVGIRMMTPDLDSLQVTLAEVLADAGYFTYGILEPWRLGFYQGLEKLNRNDNSTLQKTQWCLEALEELDDRPFFIWLYYWDPHAPYIPPVDFMRLYEPNYTWEDGKPYSRGKADATNDQLKDPSGHYAGTTTILLRLNQGKIMPGEGDKRHLMNLYDAEIAFVDSKIKDVLDKIKDLDLWDDTMVILSADHGEAFGEHGQYYHGYSIYEEEVRVPIIIKPAAVSAAGKVIDGAVRNMDIMPTILDYCNIGLEGEIRGRSLRPFMDGDLSPDLPTCIETHRIPTKTHLMGYRDGRHKLIYNLTAGETELYDLAADPGELQNLLAGETADDDTTAQLEAQLRERLLETLGVKSLAALRLGEMPQMMDDETREQLKALGYIY